MRWGHTFFSLCLGKPILGPLLPAPTCGINKVTKVPRTDWWTLAVVNSSCWSTPVYPSFRVHSGVCANRNKGLRKPITAPAEPDVYGANSVAWFPGPALLFSLHHVTKYLKSYPVGAVGHPGVFPF